MKSLNEYLIESKQQYEYRIKIAGELSNDIVTELEKSFAKFDLSSMSQPKKTPITKNPVGFMNVENEEVNIIDVAFNYPASTEQFVEIAKQAGITANKIIVLNKGYDESITDEEANKEKSDNGALLGTDYADNTPEQENLKNDYRDGHQAIVQNADKTEHKIAGGAPNKARTTNELPQGNQSPFTSVDNPKMDKV